MFFTSPVSGFKVVADQHVRHPGPRNTSSYQSEFKTFFPKLLLYESKFGGASVVCFGLNTHTVENRFPPRLSCFYKIKCFLLILLSLLMFGQIVWLEITKTTRLHTKPVSKSKAILSITPQDHSQTLM